MFEGAYNENDPNFPEPMRGYNSEQDFRRKQVRTGQAVTRTGNVPIFYTTFDGNRTDSDTLRQVYLSLSAMRSFSDTKKTVFVGDSKLLAAGNLLFLLRAGVVFVAPGERRQEFRNEILGLAPTAWKELAYASETEVKKRRTTPESEWNRFWVQEGTETLTDRETGVEFSFRKLIIRSSEEVRAATKSRNRQLAKAEEELSKVRNGIPRYYKTEDQVAKKVDKILTTRRVQAFYKIEITTLDGQPHIEWDRDEIAIEKAELTSGCYPLQTNLPKEKSADDVLKIQKDQYRVEHRFSDWKGPLKVCPIFLKNNNRIAALLTLTGMALTVLSLIEHRVREEMGDKDGFATGFLPENRRSRPTGKKILLTLSSVMALVPRHEPRIVHIANITSLAQKLFDIFDVDPKKLI